MGISGSKVACRVKVVPYSLNHVSRHRDRISWASNRVEAFEGEAILTPAVRSLDVERRRNLDASTGHGYYFDLHTFSAGWLGLDRMTSLVQGKRQYYESPALVGCTLAVDRRLYDKLWGFDAKMLMWGSEDLDLGSPTTGQGVVCETTSNGRTMPSIKQLRIARRSSALAR